MDEKNCLYGDVLPAVRSKCDEIGYELHVVNLSQESLDPAVRLAEIRRQNQVGHVIPVVLVDDSLGSPVLPQAMTRQDFGLIRPKTDVGKLFDKWYSLNTQKNHYELRNEMMFETTFETQVYK